MRAAIFLFLTIFTVQIMDVPPVLQHSNPKTCCGRTICACKHAKGAFCPFRHGLHEGSGQKEVSRKSCHLHGHEAEAVSHEVTGRGPTEGLVFSKAPCSSDIPKVDLPLYSKEFVGAGLSEHFMLFKQGRVPAFSSHALPLLRAHGLERPPRIF